MWGLRLFAWSQFQSSQMITPTSFCARDLAQISANSPAYQSQLGAGWDSLPKDLLEIIIQLNLQQTSGSATDLRLVSRQWRRSATDQIRSLRPPQISCLRSLARSFPAVKSLWLTQFATDQTWQQIIQNTHTSCDAISPTQFCLTPISSFTFQSMVYYVVPELDLYQLIHFRHLTHLRLERNTYVTNTTLKTLKNMPCLVNLNISRCTKITDAGLFALGACKGLESLNVDSCMNLTDSGFTALTQLVHLSCFSATHCTLSHRGLFTLNKLPQLRNLNLSYCYHLTLNTLKALGNLTGLTQLKLDGLQNRAQRAFPLESGFERFATLSFKDSCFGDAALASLRACQRLFDLNLSGNFEITDAGLTSLVKLSSLRVLKLERCFLTGVEPLIKMTGLRHLNIKDCSSIEFGKGAGIDQLIHLQHLNAQGCFLTAEQLAALSRLRELTHLNAARVIKDQQQACIEFGSLANLRYLNLTNWTIAKGAFASLNLCSQLTYLNLMGCNLKKRDFAHLAGLKQLAHVNCAHSQVRVEHLYAALRHLTNLTHLNLTDSRLVDKGIDQLSALAQLSTLNLSKNPGLTGQAVASLTSLTQVRGLHLRKTGLQSHQCAQLGKFPHLIYLDISSCRVGDAILPSLKMLSHLRHLDVRDTSITSGGIHHVVSAISSLRQIHENATDPFTP